jgi:hypothetical protein
MDSIEYWQNKLSSLDEKSFKAIPNKKKPVVHYLGSPNFYMFNDQCIRARVFCLNHYRLGCEHVTTSTVIKINDDGSFETLNTIYKTKPFEEETQPSAVEEMLCAA